MKVTVHHYHRVLSRNLQSWLDAGWIDTGIRDFVPSLPDQMVCVIEWHGEEAPIVEGAE